MARTERDVWGDIVGWYLGGAIVQVDTDLEVAARFRATRAALDVARGPEEVRAAARDHVEVVRECCCQHEVVIPGADGGRDHVLVFDRDQVAPARKRWPGAITWAPREVQAMIEMQAAGGAGIGEVVLAKQIFSGSRDARVLWYGKRTVEPGDEDRLAEGGWDRNEREEEGYAKRTPESYSSRISRVLGDQGGGVPRGVGPGGDQRNRHSAGASEVKPAPRAGRTRDDGQLSLPAQLPEVDSPVAGSGADAGRVRGRRVKR